MSENFRPLWFATPDGNTVYAVPSEDRWVEHQRMGSLYRRHETQVSTYSDRLHVSALLQRLEEGLLVALGEAEYAERVRHIERLKPMA
jgi:hypothetical protein